MNQQITLFTTPTVPPVPPSRRPSMPTRPPRPSPVHEYLAVISPPAAIKEDVARMKRFVARRIGDFSAQWSKAHLTVMMVQADHADEARIRALITATCQYQQPFGLRFSGYDRFLESRTIFVDPVEKEPLALLAHHLANAIRSDQRLHRRPIFRCEHPHMTVAKGLFRSDHFESLWSVFGERAYTRQMMVDHVLLLRRGIRPRTAYKVVEEFGFGLRASEC